MLDPDKAIRICAFMLPLRWSVQELVASTATAKVDRRTNN